MRVAFLCQADHAGNAYKAAQAVNRVGRIQARHITCFKHPLNFAADLVFDSVCGWRDMPPVNDGPAYDEACEVLSKPISSTAGTTSTMTLLGGPRLPPRRLRASSRITPRSTGPSRLRAHGIGSTTLKLTGACTIRTSDWL